jgi:hypothetical protein
MNRFRLSVLFFMLFSWVSLVDAQEGGGIIAGHVLDNSGASVAGAEMTLTNDHQQTLSLKTNADGAYVTPSLPIGSYTMTVKAPGFQTEQREGISVVVDAHLQINVTLKVGSVDETVTVAAENNEVNVTSTELGTVFENRPIQELPVNGRSVMALAQLSPGVARNSGQINEGFADRGTAVSAISINNGPNAANAVLIDGQSVVQPYINEISINPAANAIQQFKVESGTISAEYGFLAGGAISMVTSSGHDRFHGQIYEFLRNDAFDARSYFNTKPDRVNALRYNQYGGSISGPIGGKTSFFGNYEEYRYTLGSQVIASVPTAEWLRGDFSNLKGATGKTIPIYDPATTRANPKGNGYVRDAFPGNVIPASRLDPVAQAVNAFYPAPNRTPSNPYTHSNNYSGPSANHKWMRQFLVRVDHSFSSRHSMFARYAYYKAYTDTGGGLYSVIQPFLGLRYDNYPNQAGIIEDTFIVSPTFLNEFRLSVLRADLLFQTASYNQNWAQKLGMPNVPPTAFPRMSNGFATSSTSAEGERAGTSPELSDIVTLALGKHNLRMGVDWRLQRGYNKQSAQPSGIYTFNTTLTGNPQSTSGTGYTFASYQLGAVASAKVDTVLGASHADFTVSGFVQDTWRVTRDLTLNLGLRYDFQQSPLEQHNGLSNFDINATDPLGLRGALVFAGRDGQPRRFRNNDATNFAPRVGFAWNVFGSNTTSLRGGYGIYYPTIFTTDFFGSTTGFASTITNYTAPGGNTNLPAFYLRDGLPSQPIQPLGAGLGPDGLLGQAVTYDSKDGTTPMAQQWNLVVERSLPTNILVSAAYVGNHGTHFIAGNYNLNQLDPKYLSLGTKLQNSVPNPYAGIVPGSLGNKTITLQQSLLMFPYYTSVTFRQPHDGNYIGHSLQISVTKRTSHGLTFMVGYTKSKLIDDSISTPVDFNGVQQADVTGYQNGYNRKAERSIDPLDHSQMLRISALYDLPFGRGRAFAGNIGSWLNRAIGGWQVNTVTQWHTGTPLTITGANNYAASRPNFVPMASAKLSNPTINKWFNTEAFINPPNYTFGNVPRTLPNVRGPNAFAMDISMVKSTPITERVQSQFRVEAFNALNHPVFGLPNMTFSPGSDGMNQSGTFGTITAATPGREIQLALKLLF